VVFLELRTEDELFAECRKCQFYYSDDIDNCIPCSVFHELREHGERRLKRIQEDRIARGVSLNGIIYEGEESKFIYDIDEIERLIELGLSVKTICRVSGKHHRTIRKFREGYFKEMGYSKEEQLARTKKPKAKKRNEINRTQYQLMIENFGRDCYFCNKRGTEAHHVKYRSQGGRGKWRNLRLLCVTCHDDLHKFEDMRIELQSEHERLFGEFYYMDKIDLYEINMIEEPHEDLLESYFLKIQKGVKKNEIYD
jgi:hypothetical protein